MKKFPLIIVISICILGIGGTSYNASINEITKAQKNRIIDTHPMNWSQCPSNFRNF
jgi:hypothetical protein